MVVSERLLLPNHGKDISAFNAYVVEHCSNSPLSVMFLHGHGPHAYHTRCETIVGWRLVYRGLYEGLNGGNSAADGASAAESLRHMVSLTRFRGQPDDPPWLTDFTESMLERRLQEQTPEEAVQASCATNFAKWGVNTTSAGFYTSSPGAHPAIPTGLLQGSPAACPECAA